MRIHKDTDQRCKRNVKGAVKRSAALLLAAAMGMGVLTGCKAAAPAAAGGYDDDGVLELEFYNRDGQEDLWDNPVAQKLTEATNVRLKVDYPVGGDEQRIALMIAEQNFPDIIYAKGDVASLVDAGALIDMTDLIEQYGPNIKKMYGDEFDKLKYSAEDPSIYQLSSYAMGDTILDDAGNAQIQWAVLKENDYKVPRTLDEFETMLKDYMAAHPTTEEGLPTIGLTLSASDWHWLITLGNPAGSIADGAPDNGQWLIDEDYNAMYKFRSDAEREYFRWLNRMYHEGVLDHEFATQTHEDYIAKVSSGRVLALVDKEWDYQDAERVLIADGKVDKTYAPLPLTIGDDVKCPTLMSQGLVTGQGVAITTACRYPEEAIRFLDYICSDEGQVLVNWGVEGINYFVDENGMRYRTQEEIDLSKSDKDYSRKTGVGFYAYPFPTYGRGVLDPAGNAYTTASRETVIAEYNEEERAGCRAWGVELLMDIFPQPEEFEVPKFTPLWAYAKPAEVDDISDKLDEIAWSSLITCIAGRPEDFDASYDAMLAEFEGSGMSEAERMIGDIVKAQVKMLEE